MNDNPFASRYQRPGSVPYFSDDPALVARLADRLVVERGPWQIVGPHGSGKSTLLAALQGEFARRGVAVELVVQGPGQRQLPADMAGRFARWPRAGQRVLLVDGYEQLSWISRWRLSWLVRRARAGLLVTCHADAGFAPLYTTRVDLRLAERIVAHLTRDQPGTISSAELRAAYEASGGDLREMLFALYDVCEARRA